MKKRGFTLIETLVVVGAIMLIMTSIGGIMFAVFSSKSRNEANDKISQNGNWILNELKKNILNASNESENGVRFTCPVGDFGNSITITNVKDGDKTMISCFNTADGFKIASISAKAVGTTVFLFQKNNDLTLIDCSDFVTCSTLPSLQLSEVKFKFRLGAGVFGSDNGVTKPFFVDITLRN